jgi:hypothetical protein
MAHRRLAPADFSIRERNIVITPAIIHKTIVGSKIDVGFAVVVGHGELTRHAGPGVRTLTRDDNAGKRVIKAPPAKPSPRSRSLPMGAFKS